MFQLKRKRKRKRGGYKIIPIGKHVWDKARQKREVQLVKVMAKRISSAEGICDGTSGEAEDELAGYLGRQHGDAVNLLLGVIWDGLAAAARLLEMGDGGMMTLQVSCTRPV